MTRRRKTWLVLSTFLCAELAAGASAASFSSGAEMAAKFGVHEVVLDGGGKAERPFDFTTTVTFVPPSGEMNAKSVSAFYDGDNTWRARVYVSEAGRWSWTSSCATDATLHGKSGVFLAAESTLRGRLLGHPKNPRHWMTENGRWFLNLNDTAYFLLCPYAGNGEPVTDEDFRAYVRDAVDHGITSFRSFTLIGPGGYLDDSPNFAKRWFEYVFDQGDLARLNLENLRVVDRRLRWLLEAYPEVYVQFILFSRGAKYASDDKMWVTFTPEQKERVMRYMIARFAAYPQLFWLVTNDAHCGAKYPNNTAMAREVGEYFHRHDPWKHPLATGPARGHEYLFGHDAWSSYVHLEENFSVGAAAYEKYHALGKPVFLGEDRYEQDRPEDRDPRHMRYFQRRLFWAWLLSGGSTNYGGRWWVVHPYTETGARDAKSPWPVINGGEYAKDAPTYVHSGRLTGLDSVRPIRDFFVTRDIELADFEPDHGLVSDADGATGARAPKLMRRGQQEFLIYHPNAAADDRDARPDEAKTAGMVVDLRGASGKFSVEWYRPLDGTSEVGGVVAGEKTPTLRAPWPGEDVVVRLVRERPVEKIPGLVCAWDFREPAGEDRVARGPHPYRLQETGGPIERVSGGPYGAHAARLKAGQWFRIKRGDFPALDLHGPEARLTVVAWLRREVASDWQAIAGVWNETQNQRQYCLFLNASARADARTMTREPCQDLAHGHVSDVGGRTRDQPACITYGTSPLPVSVGQWHMVAMTYDGHHSRVYVDGRFVADEGRNPFPLPGGLFHGDAEFTVGAVDRYGKMGNFFDGTLAGLAIYARALSEGELAVLAQR